MHILIDLVISRDTTKTLCLCIVVIVIFHICSMKVYNIIDVIFHILYFVGKTFHPCLELYYYQYIFVFDKKTKKEY